MKKFILLLILSLIPALVLAEETVRTWTTSAGKEMVGVWEMEKDTDEEKIHIRSNGKLFRVAVKKLSEADQTYITEKRTASRSMDDDAFEEVEETETGSSDRGMAIVEKGNRYALLIGVNQYAKPIRSLRFCMNDMKTLAESFQKIGVPKENIFLMTDDSELERRPTRANIMRQIESITRLMGEGDQLTIAFSGHGVMVDGKSYLCPSDTDLENRDSIVSRDWAFEQLEKCAARQKIFIVDACRDEVAFGGSKGLGGAKTLDDPIGAETHGFVLIASCDREQKSWEDENLEHGVFTHFLAEGLSGAAGDEDGYVSILDLFQYASRKTKKYVFREFNRVQVPTFRQGSEMTDFILAKLESDSSSVPPTVSEPVTPPEPPKPAVRKAGERMVKTVDGIEYAFRWCPAGSFLMGSPSSESGRDSDETQHSVTLTRGFWMLETEVTQAMWQSVMGTSIRQQRDKVDTSWSLAGEGSDYPMYFVSWEECRSFCEKLSEKLGLTVSLPTEAQWEYACRAGTTGAYAGDLGEMGWYDEEDTGSTHPVGQKKPNAWGLYDMHGNVWEWCQDKYGSNYYTESPTSDPCNLDSSEPWRVYRGGCWLCDAQGCRSAIRSAFWPDDRFTPDCRSNNLGFRPVLASPVPEE
ncbi:MAG: SUMF1/EgtB/PvdO family nonheme iron enzyme [Thermoguttaceae bacterium]|nr:SUMF1/EgtB/PvdO family nonheme iron enzyme [Thermoguttaceae bacterium]